MVINGCQFLHVHREIENSKPELGLEKKKGTAPLYFLWFEEKGDVLRLTGWLVFETETWDTVAWEKTAFPKQGIYFIFAGH